MNDNKYDFLNRLTELDDYEIEKTVNNMIDRANQSGGSDNITTVIMENDG